MLICGVSISPELDAALHAPIKLAKAICDINRYTLAKIEHGNLEVSRVVSSDRRIPSA